VTNGGDPVAGGGGAQRAGGGWRRDPRAMTMLAFVGVGLLYMAVNAASFIDQRRLLGRPIAGWQAWTFEGTSFVAWLVLVPLIPWVAERLAPRPVWQAAIGHLAACAALSLVHTVLMVALRVAIFALAGDTYVPGDTWPERLVFEARKDLITYVSVAAAFLLLRRLVAPPSATPAPAPGEPPLIEVRDGSRLVMLRPEEIDWIGAAGNYVELHGAFGTELARRTMADIEAELGSLGFVRVHRSRLVRRAAIAALQTRQSGDVDITLRSGAVIVGSRRYRGNL
jgi:hypothetical protein